MDILPFFVEYVCNVLADKLRAQGLLSGIVVEDEKLRKAIVSTINDALSPFIA